MKTKDFNNSYNRNQYEECIEILNQMNNILKGYENQGINNKRISRFYLAIYCRYGLIGLILMNIKYINIALEGMNNQLLLLQNDLNSKKVRNIFKAYTFSLNLLRLNSGIFVDKPKQIGDNFMKDIFEQNINSNNNTNIQQEENFCKNRTK